MDNRWSRPIGLSKLAGSANLPDPHVLAGEIADDLRSALEQIEDVLADPTKRAERLDATS